MSGTARIGISLPQSVLEEIEKDRKKRGESRSEFFRRAAEELLRQNRLAQAEEQYQAGYLRYPETPEEIEAADRAGVELLSKVAWD